MLVVKKNLRAVLELECTGVRGEARQTRGSLLGDMGMETPLAETVN